jgi:hypothetical protein
VPNLSVKSEAQLLNLESLCVRAWGGDEGLGGEEEEEEEEACG